MIPILFSENSTTFTTNGIGRLADAFSCNVVEERNGEYELQMSYPMTGQHYSDISIRSIIVAKPSANATLQAFRVYKVTKPINGKVTVFAQHISYDLSKNVSMPFSITAANTACNSTLQGLKTNAVETCPFTFWTDVNTVASYKQATPASIRQRLGGVEGSVLDQFGGEYEWDNWTVKLHKNRGVEKNITLRYGKNITDLEQEEEIANTVTGVVPFWINTDKTESVTLPERAVYSQNASRYSAHMTVPLDLSAEFQNKPTVEQLRNKATVYVNKSGFGLPKVSIKVSFVNLADTEEYKDILPLQECSLCDTIKVQFERLGIDSTAKVVKTDYDVLREKYNSVEIGSVKSNLATTINDMNASMVSAIEATSERVYADVNLDVADIVDNATAWLTSSGGYVIAVKNNDGSWKELLFMDTNDVQTAHNVLRINENGIGFSSRGVAGPYTQAWTLDGKLVIGGTNVPSITAYDSHNNIIFQASATAMIWNASNSSMSANGTITASNANFTNATLNGGSFTIKNGNIEVFKVSSSGELTVKDTSNDILFQASSSKVIWNAPNSSMSADGTITMNGANINNGSILQVYEDWYEKTWLKIVDGEIIGGTWEIPPGSSTPVYTRSGRIYLGTLGNPGIGLVSDNSIQITANSGTISIEGKNIALRCTDGVRVYDESYGTNASSGTYISDVTLKTFKELFDTYVTVSKTDGVVVDVTCVTGQDKVPVNPVKHTFINGIATDDIVI